MVLWLVGSRRHDLASPFHWRLLDEITAGNVTGVEALDVHGPVQLGGIRGATTDDGSATSGGMGFQSHLQKPYEMARR